MKIKQVSELTGVSASAIRYYESQGFLPATKRTAGGYRQYSQEGDMLLKTKPIQWVLLLSVLLLAIAPVTISLENPSAEEQTSTLKTPQLDVFKSPTCGCCQKWIEHIENHGFSTTTHHPVDLAAVKSSYGIQGKYRSCHTSVSSDGYVFEGHVPAKYMRQFMHDKPANAIGLSVPAMPIGSPGMEVAERFTPYQILMLFKDGTSKVYTEINRYSEQF